MRRTTVLLAACLALAGCSDSGGGDSAASTPSPSASPSVAPVIPFMKSVEDAAFASYETGIPPFQELEVFPPEWCAALDEGHSVEWMFDMSQGALYPVGQEWGTEKGDAYQLVVLGVKAYCPENEAAVTEELRALGVY
jgi:hypothetical protein